jgi:hypothetical protein
MDLVSIEAPSPRVTLPGKPPKFLNTLFRIVAARQLLQVVANQLIEALRESRRQLPRTSGELLVDRVEDIHLHSICVHGLRVSSRVVTAVF